MSASRGSRPVWNGYTQYCSLAEMSYFCLTTPLPDVHNKNKL